MPLPLAVAVSVFAPSWTVQLPTVATPSAPVVAFAPVTLPPPLATANVTATLGTGRLAASRTTAAVSVFSPAPVPSVQRPTVATPFASVWVAPPDTVPLPAVAANVTATPGTWSP